MIDLSKIEGFEWDEGNTHKPGEHDVSQEEAEGIFFTNPIFAPDVKHSQTEERTHAFGITKAGRLLHVTFTLRVNGRKIRVISARDMSRKERRIYHAKKTSEADSSL
ncbi:MAG: BrnT family toxin [Candidatus Tectomicrobia bacterium]|nr:BrnT family toxin [Candidatus Tectomicrobia bacterium]